MVQKKELEKLKRELSEIVSDNKTIEEKIEELDDLGDGSLSEEEKEFNSLVAATDRMKSVVLKNIKTEEEFESSKNAVKSIVDRMQDLRKRLAEFEEKFQKYNVPKLTSESFLDYLNKLHEFMKIWKEEVEKGREKGEKSLIEWLKKLGQSDQEERKNTFEEMKDVAINLGIQISHCLIEYFLLMTVSVDSHTTKQKVRHVAKML